MVDFETLRRSIKERVVASTQETYRLAGLTIDLKPDSAARLKGLCPFHSEKAPSFKIDLRTGRWRCHGACHDGGDVIDCTTRLHHESSGRATMRLAEALGLAVPIVERAKPASAKDNLRDQLPSHSIVERLRANLARLPDRRKYLQLVRGLSEAMIDEAAIGVWRDRYALPVYSTGRSEVLDIRLYLPDAKDANDKMQGWRSERGKEGEPGYQPGTGSPKLFFAPGWRQPIRDETVLFTEGELDCLLLTDLGFRALTNTCGAGHLPMNGSVDFAGAKVKVIGDCDEAGDRHNSEVAKWAYAHGAEEVHAVLWAEATREHFDVTDVLLQYGLLEDRARAAATLEELLRNAVPVPEAPLLFGPFEDFSRIKALVRETTWLWPNWIPNGCLTIIGGDQESGKSFFGLRLAQSVILGTVWPDGTGGPEEVGPVLWVEAEACHAVTAQRAETMGIPLDKLKHMPTALDGWMIDKPDHLATLKLYARQERVRMIVIDSLSTAYSGDENSSDMREALSKLAAVARDLDIPVVLIHHLNKPGPLDTKEFDCNRLRGSSAIKQIARSIIGIDHPEPSNPARRVTLAKCNFLPEKPKPLGYELRFDCLTCFGDAPEVQKDETKLEAAITFLVNELGTGPAPATELQEKAAAEGISGKTLERAKKELGAKAFYIGRKSHWGLK